MRTRSSFLLAVVIAAATSVFALPGAASASSMPSAPRSLSVYTRTATSLDLSWRSVSGASGYRLSLNGVQSGTTTWTDWTFQHLTCNTAYTFGVAATNAAGTSSVSTLRATTAACPVTDKTPPTAPGVPSVSGLSQSGATVTWGPATDNVGVVAYDVAIDGAGSVRTTSLTQTYSSLACATSHTVSVAARDAAGNVGPAVSATFTTSACPAGPVGPTTPAGLSVWQHSSTSLGLSWAPSTSGLAPLTYRLTLNGAASGTTTWTDWTFQNLKCGTTYTLGVLAADSAGSTSALATLAATTDACAGSADTTAPTAPGAVTAANISQTGATVTWGGATDNVGVAGYDVSLDNAAPIANTTLSQVLSGLACGTAHTVSVDARDAAGNVGPSVAGSFTTGACSTQAPPPPPPASSSGLQLGVYRWSGLDALPNSFANYQTWLGHKVSYGLDFEDFSVWSNVEGPDWQLNAWQANQQYRLILSVPMVSTQAYSSGSPSDAEVSTVLQQCANGAFNSHYTALGQSLVRHGLASTIVRLGWEMNGGWFIWRAAPNPSAWVSCFRQEVTAIRAADPQATILWNPNAGWNQLDAANVYPGDAYVDYIGLDQYDQSWIPNYTDPAARWNDFLTTQDGLNWLSSFAGQHSKPMVFGEWGEVVRSDGHGGGDDPLFINNMFQWMNAHSVAISIYFEVNASDGDHQLSNGATADGSEFSQSATAFRNTFGKLP